MKHTLLFVFLSAFMLNACSKKQAVPSTVKINISSEPDSLDPWQSAAADTQSVFSNVFEGLLKVAPDGTLIPAIAESYTVSDNKLIYTFKIRKNIIFHNNKTLTSKDVLYSYNAFTGLNGTKAVSNKFKSVKSLSSPDDNTFIVELSSPDASFLALNTNAVLPEGYETQSDKPIGTGPYEFVSYVPGQKIVFKRNAAYYNKEAMPKIENVEVYIMTDSASVISALRSGQLDIAYFIYGDDAEQLESKFTIFSAAQNMVQLFGLNNGYKPLQDIRVRKAINYAVNKKDIIDGVWSGYADELYTNFSPALKTYYNDSLSASYQFNLEKAKQLMSDAGYADGFDLTITVPANYEPHVQAAEILVSQLAKINIRAKLEMVEWATWLDKVYTKAQYESTVIAFVGKIEPNDILAKYDSNNKRNFIQFHNAEYDSLLKSALSETNTEKRIALYKQCQKLLTENAASVFICDPNLIVAAKQNLHGYTFYPITFIDFSKWYFE